MAEMTVTRMRRPPAAAYKVINPVMGHLLRSPLHGPIGKRLLLLEYTGRKSGKRFRLPVGYVRAGNELLLATQSRWRANFRGGAPVRVWLDGKRRPAFAELIEDETEVADALGRMVRAQPDFGQIIGVGVGPDGQPSQGDLARAIAGGFAAIRVTLGA
jgi:deazaflavin-dependent oxidoreductase (nitroreductase family)